MPSQTLYKYRSLATWAPIIDIIANERLYAAPFEALNDPMEGRYYYFSDAVSEGLRKAIYQSKLRRNICSFSAAKNNTLLWSYYANGHTGVAFAVQLKTKRGAPKTESFPVRYDSSVYIGQAEAKRSADSLAVNVLTQKQLPWAHEQEIRVFSPSKFVNVKLVEVLLGCNIANTDEELIRTLIRKWHPRLKITKVNRSALDEPNAVRGPRGEA